MSIACDPASLYNQAKCFSGLNQKQLLMVTCYLLCQVANVGTGGGGASCLLGGDVDPTIPPPGNCPYSIYYNRTTDSFWFWTKLSTWQEFIGP
jgi:hypothetical protein